MMNWEEKAVYEFRFSDGSTRVLRYDGLGRSMQPIWVDPLTSLPVHPLPTFVSYRRV